MPRVITAHVATIQTATVEIQTMKVGKKQVTMGMFRQLPYRQIIDPSALEWFARLGPLDDEQYFSFLLHGQPWGHVNYWWYGADTEDYFYAHRGHIYYPNAIPCHGEKRHVVWQSVDEEPSTLYRSIVCEQPASFFLEGVPNPDDVRALWAPCWDKLARLPQLFIAV